MNPKQKFLTAFNEAIGDEPSLFGSDKPVFYREAKRKQIRETRRRVNLDLSRLLAKNISLSSERCSCGRRKWICVTDNNEHVLCPFELFVQLERIRLVFGLEPQFKPEDLLI